MRVAAPGHAHRPRQAAPSMAGSLQLAHSGVAGSAAGSPAANMREARCRPAWAAPCSPHLLVAVLLQQRVPQIASRRNAACGQVLALCARLGWGLPVGWHRPWTGHWLLLGGSGAWGGRPARSAQSSTHKAPQGANAQTCAAGARRGGINDNTSLTQLRQPCWRAPLRRGPGRRCTGRRRRRPGRRRAGRRRPGRRRLDRRRPGSCREGCGRRLPGAASRACHGHLVARGGTRPG